jgi:hypothetical protein
VIASHAWRFSRSGRPHRSRHRALDCPAFVAWLVSDAGWRTIGAAMKLAATAPAGGSALVLPSLHRCAGLQRCAGVRCGLGSQGRSEADESSAGSGGAPAGFHHQPACASAAARQQNSVPAGFGARLSHDSRTPLKLQFKRDLQRIKSRRVPGASATCAGLVRMRQPHQYIAP